MEEKRCSKCKEYKDVSMFGVASSQASGLQPRCNKCMSILRKDHYLKNKTKRKKYSKQYFKTQAGKIVSINSQAKRKAQKLNSMDGSIPEIITYPLTIELHALLTKQDNKCYLCNTDISSTKHLDHWIPLSKGGSHSIDNVIWLCPTCNLQKSAKVPSELLLI